MGGLVHTHLVERGVCHLEVLVLELALALQPLSELLQLLLQRASGGAPESTAHVSIQT